MTKKTIIVKKEGFELISNKRNLNNIIEKTPKNLLIIVSTLIFLLIEFIYHYMVGLDFFTVFLFLTLNLVFIGLIGEFLINSATKLAVKLKVSPFLIGLVLIPMFASLPEDLITVLTNMKDKSMGENVLAQILGNNLFELLIVFGIGGIFACYLAKKCVVVQQKDKILFMRNGLILLIGSVLVFVLVFFDRNLTFVDSIILLIFYGIFILVLYFSNRLGVDDMVDLPEELPKPEDINGKKELGLLIIFIFLVLGCGNFFVEEVIFLAQRIPNFQKFAFLYIGIAIAIPELILTVVGFSKGKEDIGIGLVIGGAIWDSIVSIAVQGIVNPLYNISLIVIYLFMIVSIMGILVAMIYIRTQWRLKIWEASILILAFITIVIIVIFII